MFIYFYYLIFLLFSVSLLGLDTPHLLQELEAKRQNFETERLTHAFTVMDELFKKSVIKKQKLDNKQQVIRESTKSLYDFLNKPHKQEKITILLNQNTKLTQTAQEFLNQKNPESFAEAIKILWENKHITLKEANKLIAKISPMSAEELIRLVENGACLTSSGYLIQLRTGLSYGDALKLSDDIEILFRKIREEEHVDLPNEPLLNLLDGPYRDSLVNAFSLLGMSDSNHFSDAHVLTEMRKYLIFLNRTGPITGLVNPAPNANLLNPIDTTYIMLSPQQLSAAYFGNYYLSDQAYFSQALTINPLGIGYSSNISFPTHGPDWWLYYTNGYLGGGFDYTVNFDQGALWSNGYASYLSIGGSLSGWKNQLSAGITMQTLLTKGIGAGASVYVNIAREHNISYLDTYPLDGKFKNIRGLHQIEITDKHDKGISTAVAFNFSAAGAPIAVAFKAGAQLTQARTYRTHTHLGQAQDMLKESDLSNLLISAGKDIKKTRIPQFDNPELLIDGDELIEIKTGKLNGAFVIGLQTVVPIYAIRAGTSIDLVAEFELGLRRLPNDKFEVSIEPRRVHELSIFASMLNILGAGHVKSMAVAKKQIFIFDFKRPEGRLAYFDLIHQGRLPTGEEIEVSTEDRGPEHLIAEFRAQNKIIQKRGVERIFLEAMYIDTVKSFAGFNAPIIPAVLFLLNKAHDAVRKNHRKLNIQFEGKDREFMRSATSSVATNGIVAVRRITSGGRVSHGQGFSGRYNQDLFVTHRRIHSIQEKPNGETENTWAFESLILHAQLEDTIITGDQENQMAELINKLFSAYIGSFEYENSKSPRIINLERVLTRKDFAELLSPDTKDRINQASQASGIDQTDLSVFLKKLKNKHADQQGLIVKQFVEGHTGFSGFSAIHQILGARPEDISISTESGYSAAAQEANNFIIKYSELKNIFIKNKSKKIIKYFYREAHMHLRELDHQLRLLYDDKYLIDSNSPLYNIFGAQKVQELIANGARQDKTAAQSALVSAHKAILDLMDLSLQGFSQSERLKIYRKTNKKHLRLLERTEIFIYENFNGLKNQAAYKQGFDLLDKINARIVRLSQDKVLNALNPEYVSSQQVLYKTHSSWIEKILRRYEF